MATTKRCYYEVLQVTREADEATIKTAYRKIAWENHPDRNHDDPEAESRFKEASEAYEVLRDPQKRQLYDRYGHAGLESRGASPHFDDLNSIFDMFGGLFGDLFGGQRRGRGGPQPGRDLQLNLRVSLLDAYRGGKRTVTIPRDEPCKTCSGSGIKPGSNPARCRRCEGRGAVLQGQSFFRMQVECPACHGRGVEITDPCQDCRGEGHITREESIELTIPPGIDDGVTMRVNGQGEPGAPGAQAGDLYVVFQVEKSHNLFERYDLDLHCQIPITFSQAALGGQLEVPTLDGEMRSVDLPRGSQAGDEIRLRGMGMPALRGQKRGDIVVHLRLITPRKLTKRQEELFRELAQLDESHVPPERKSFLDRIKEFFGGSSGK